MNEQQASPDVKWNNSVTLILSDVDETIAPLFGPASPAMATELNGLLDQGKSFFLISGAGADSIKGRVVDLIKPASRKRILVGHCSGAEVIGFDDRGDELEEPFYSLYDQMLNQDQKKNWRRIVGQLVSEFHLVRYPTVPLAQFKKEQGDNPLAIMYDDRGPQITLEMVNAAELTRAQIEKLRTYLPDFDGPDLRIPVMERAAHLLDAEGVPITPRIAGTFALDLALKGVSKATVVRFAVGNPNVLAHIGLKPEDIRDPDTMEVWGDKFSLKRGGTDRHILEGLPRGVRAIDFRQENPSEFTPGFNTVLWTGHKQLHNGLLEYLQSRPKRTSGHNLYV